MSHSKINSKKDYEKIAKEMEIIFDHIPGLVFFKDTKNKFIHVNKYLAEAHKMTKEEMIGKSYFDLYPKDQAQAYWKDDMEVVKSGTPKLNIEELWETEKGKSWVSTSKIPYFDENGKIKGIIGYSIDISERKMAEKKYKTIIQNTLDGVWITDINGRFLDVNDLYCQMIGYTREELLKMSISDIDASEKSDVTDRYMKKVMNQEYDRFETQHRHKDGHIVEIEVSVNYLNIEEGRLFVFLRDISERKKDQQKLKNSQEQMNSIFSNLKDTVFIISDNHEILFKNELAHTIFGEDLVGRKCYKIIKGLDHPCDRCPMITIIETNVCQVRFEQCVSFSDTKETKFFDIIMTPIENYGGQHAFVEFLRDSTENRKLRDKLKESEEKYRGLYDSIKDGIIMMDMEGKILETNQAYLDMLDYTTEEVKEFTYIQLTPEKWHKLEENIVKNQILSRGYSDEYEKEYIKKDGNLLPISIRLWLIKDKNGNSEGIWGIIRDISERKMVEANLKQNETIIRALLNAIPESAFLMDTKGVVLAANETVASRFSTNLNNLIGSCMFDFLPPQVAEERKKQIEKVIQKGQPEQFEDERFGRYIYNSIYPVFNEKNEVINLATIGYDITERKMAEKELEAQKEWFQVTLSSIGDAVIATDITSNITFMNSTAEKLTGWTIEEAKNKSINEIFNIYNEKTGKSAENPVNRVIQEGNVVGLANHTVLISKDGIKRNIADSGASTINKNNKLIGVVLVFRDITQEYALRNAIEQSKKDLENLNKQLEQRVEEKTGNIIEIMEKLKNSEEKYRTIITNLDEGFYNVTIQGTLIDHNKRFNEIFGFNISKDLKGVQLPDFWQNPVERESYIQELIKNGFIKNYLIKAKKQDGDFIFVSANSHIIFDQKGAPLRIEGIFVDRTKEYLLEQDLKKTFINLKESETKFRLLIENLPVGIVIHDADTNVISCNKKAEELLGLSYEQMIGKKAIDKDWKFIKEDRTPIPLEEYPVNLIISSKKPLANYIGGIITSKSKDVSWDLVNGYPHIDENGVLKSIITTNMDITVLKNTEFELQKTLNDLRRSNEELEQFAYVASHDLQEPLRMVASFTQLLAKRYKDKLDKDANDFINFAVDGATRMQNLINDLLTFSRVGTRGKLFTQTDTNTILKTVLNNLRESIEETKAKITYDPLPVIMADDSQMMQLFQNLISNAIKFHRTEVNPEIHISAEAKKDEWVYYVRDNGIGIDNQFFDRLFIIFQRLHKKDEYGGSGIGLAVCKKIVQRHGGKIWVESEPGKGSTFYFTIPKKEILYNSPEKAID